MAGHECVGFCEFDRFAVASYTSMHLLTDSQRDYLMTLPLKQRQKEILNEEYRNGEWFAPDIRTVRADELPRSDCWCFGAPCFVKGMLVTTSEGLKPIEEIEVGDMVLTHKNRFKGVDATMKHDHKGIYSLKVQGSPVIQCTGNHRFYVRYKSKVWNSDKRGWDVVWSAPEWKRVDEFTGDEFMQIVVNKNHGNRMNLTSEECWLLGRYVADGYRQDYPRKNRPSNTQRVAFCIGNTKIDEFEKHIDGYKFHKDKNQKSCTKYLTCNKRLFELCGYCGDGAENKHIPGFIMDLPKEMLSHTVAEE